MTFPVNSQPAGEINSPGFQCCGHLWRIVTAVFRLGGINSQGFATPPTCRSDDNLPQAGRLDYRLTCADLNGCVKGAVENGAAAFNYDYPPAMGGQSIKVALDILAGKPVPKYYEMSVDIAITKGDETESVKADKWVEDYARLDAPSDLILSTGIPNYDPTTFSVEYPQ